jgi:hypothetical protein
MGSSWEAGRRRGGEAMTIPPASNYFLFPAIWICAPNSSSMIGAVVPS